MIADHKAAPTRVVRASVIVPAYNAEQTVGRAIESALAQTEARCEVLVIDDASSDATVAVATEYAERDDRVRVLCNSVNRGPAGARNHGICEARGEWIALLDADDSFAPHRIETLLQLGELHAADIVADNILLCPLDGSGPCQPMLSAKDLPESKWLTTAAFIAGNVGSRWTPRVSFGFFQPVIRRDFVQRHDLRYDERNRFGEDFMFYTACLLRGARWWLMPEPMYHYSIRDGSLTDVQSAADLLRIRSMEDRLLHGEPLVAADAALLRAIRSHKALIDRFYYYRAFTDAVKARAGRRALELLFESPRGLWHIMFEGMLRAPTIGMKALRGGYHRGV